MCLTFNKKPQTKIANRAIKCYKIVDSNYAAIFYRKDYTSIGVLNKAKNIFGKSATTPFSRTAR